MKTREYLLYGESGYNVSCLEWPCETAQAILLCLHGFAGDKKSSVIKALGEKLSPQSVLTVTFDWPGHGSSPADSSYLSVENCISDLNAVIGSLKKTAEYSSIPIYLFATSFGGFIGLNYIARYPFVFSKVVLRSPALNMPETFLSLCTDEEIKLMKSGDLINKSHEYDLPVGLKFYDDLCQHRLQAGTFPSGIPGLIIQGDTDDVVDPRDSVEYAEKNGLSLHMIRGADHRYKKPGELEEIVKVTSEFLFDL